jgi:intraflagellar transport protein 46
LGGADSIVVVVLLLLAALCDVPIHKSRIESLHLLFTLFSEFKASQHFRTQDEAEEIEHAAAVVEAEADVITFD